MKGDHTKTDHMLNQKVREGEVNIQVEKKRKSSYNNHNSTNDISLKHEKKCDKKLAKIHEYTFDNNYEKLLTSDDPILTDSELVEILSDPNDNSRRNDKKPDDLGIKKSSKAKKTNVNDKSQTSSVTNRYSRVTKVPTLRTAKLSNDNKKCSTSTKNVTHDNKSHLKLHPQNTTVPEHQDMLEGPQKKKKN